MIFRGFGKTFSTQNNGQYQTIGEYWDMISTLYGLANLRGLGYHWTADSMEYLIGLKSGEPFDLDVTHEGFVWKEILLPDAGWQEYRGFRDNLSGLYKEIYHNGILKYEIEEFSEDGSCRIFILRG